MGFRIVIAGESQCESFAECCLVADFLIQNLPDFCYDRVEIPILNWQIWLSKINQKNKWHHVGSPLIWKEMLMAGSKAFYIGGAPQFLDYCYSYYDFDSLFACNKYEDLIKNIVQYKKKISEEKLINLQEETNASKYERVKKDFVITISGASNELTMHLLSGLLEMDIDDKSISKIYIYDEHCPKEFMLSIEKQCAYIQTFHPDKTVKYAPIIGFALTCTNLLIILDHIPFRKEMSIGEWLYANSLIINKLSLVINASGNRQMYIIFPNLGPACFNATMLREQVTIVKDHIVVATSDLGLEILPIVAEITGVPSRNIFCPPVWGFVGINHLVDIRTTIQRYDTFVPYNRYIKVKNSSLKIGSIIPELRTMEYLTHFDESIWRQVAEEKKKYLNEQPYLNKSVAVLNLVKLWLFKQDSNDIINLGLFCDGSFGLKFNGIFSQPARLLNNVWTPATDFLLPKDTNINLYYLEEMATRILKLQKNDLPPLVPFFPCSCKPKLLKRKEIWYSKMMVLANIDKIRTKNDFILLQESVWPWLITHFRIAEKYFVCGFPTTLIH